MRLVRFAVALLVVACLSAVTGLLIAGEGPWAGPRLFGLTREHGVHEGDLPVIALWLVGVVGCLWLARAGRRDRRE